MSGICGIYFFDRRPVEDHTLQNMLNALSYRGPDNSNIWYEGSIGLGNCLLCTTPESINEKLPLVSKDGNLILVADARIDNRDELLSTLNISNQSISDSEVILNAYQQWDEDCSKKLIGDYAFAIWDKREKKLFCARDALGVRPFYYYKGDNFFVFASGIEGIFALPNAKKELNIDSLLDYLVGNCKDFETTEFKNLFRLRPAHTLTITESSYKFHQYWDVEPNNILKLNKIEDYEEAFLSVFKKSITCRLRTCNQPGILVSGGLDSSSILCMIEDLKAKNKINTGIEGYSAIFPKESFSEEEYVFSIQQKWGSKINFIEPSVNYPLWEFNSRAICTTLPTIGPQYYIFQDIVQKALLDGKKVLLTGHGGDEFMSSSLSLAKELLLSGQPVKAFDFINNYSRFQEIFPLNAFYSIAKSLLINFIPKSLKRINSIKRLQKYYPWLKENLLKDVYDKIHSGPWYLTGKTFHKDTRKETYLSVHYGYLKRVIEETSALFLNFGPIENRMPFYDRRLVELMTSIPDEVISYNGTPKGLLRKSLDKILPLEIKNRRIKMGVTFNISKELITKHSLRVKELLTSPILESLNLIDKQKTKKEYDFYCTKYANRLTNTPTNLWNVLALEAWLKNITSEDKGNKNIKELIYNQ